MNPNTGGIGETAIRRKLVRAGVVDQTQVDRAMEVARKEGLTLQHVLVERLGLLTHESFLKTVAQSYGLPYVDLATYKIDPEAIALLPREVAERFVALPLYAIAGTLTIAIANPMTLLHLDQIELSCKCHVKAALAREDEIRAAIEHHFREQKETVDQVVEALGAIAPDVAGLEVVADGPSEEDLLPDELVGDAGEESSPIVKLVNSVLILAVKRRATDIHLEPQETHVRLRFRIDGCLTDIHRFPRSLLAHSVSRIKILANMNISERRVPQDGRIRLRILERPVDFRVSTVPTVLGEKVVLRVLDKKRVALDLALLGFEPEVLTSFRECLHAPYGMILATGPTGSGKTTTLYAALNELNEPGMNISTLEDPVEYNLPGVNQVQIHAKQGLTFENGLEAFLRQDPDVIMLGEMRSLETIQTAVRAALTGHLLFSTLHTNSATETVVRLADMGVEPFLIASALQAVIAQRLLRRVCESCAEPDGPAKAKLAEVLPAAADAAPRRARGCPACDGIGYRGMVAVYELLRVTPVVREAMGRGVSGEELTRVARAEGMRTLKDAALSKVAAGVTTLEEAASVFPLH